MGLELIMTIRKLIHACILSGFITTSFAGDMTAAEINERLLGVKVPFPTNVKIEPKASQSELGELTSEILSHLLISVEDITYGNDETAFVKANFGNSKCELHYKNTSFEAQLSSGTITCWKLTEINCL